MSWLGEWLKELILIVLIAVFIDLLLPNRAMERYVKFVVSLLILLTMLSPVMRLFSGDASKQLEAAFSRSIGDLSSDETRHSTEMILQQGEELRKKRESEALEWAGEEAARQMKEQIVRETGQPVQRVSVKMVAEPVKSSSGEKKEGKPTEEMNPTISAVEVVLAEAKSEQRQADPENGVSEQGAEISITPIEKVEIRVKKNTNDPNAEIEASPETNEAMAETRGETGAQKENDGHLKAQISDLLSRNWGIAKEAVTVMDPVMETK
ncbi:stage III sporulation protein AF [Paenibacillus puldeungensis]|uniref:Stage III sporulation protein AF n=1 Tax=Paenibacillus puldeungensis TaxID=696536 RepID=A0ABW3RWK9_9BACL